MKKIHSVHVALMETDKYIIFYASVNSFVTTRTYYITCALLMWSIHSVATAGELALRMNQVEATWNSLSTTAQKEPNRKNNKCLGLSHFGNQGYIYSPCFFLRESSISISLI